MLGNLKKLNLSMLLLAAVSAQSPVIYAEKKMIESGSLTNDDAAEILDNLEKNLSDGKSPKKEKSAPKYAEESKEKTDTESVKPQVEPSLEKSANNQTAPAAELPSQKSHEKTDEKASENSVSQSPEQAAEKPATQRSLEPAPAVNEEASKAVNKSEQPITTTTPSSQSEPVTKKSIKDIETKIQEYDTRIDILESDLARIQSSLHDASVTDNKVLIEVRTQKSAKFVIRDLNAQLDGSRLYEQKDTAGIWMPNQTVAVFHGPLKPGNHNINIHAIIAPLSNEGLKLPTWQHKAVESAFDIEIPEGRSRKHFVVELSDDAESSSKPRAKIAESDYK